MEVNVLVRSKSKETIQSRKQLILEVNKQSGDKLRKEKEDSTNIISKDREAVLSKKIDMYKTIKGQHNELKEKREKDLDAKMEASRKVVEGKIAAERELTRESEIEISSLEQEELEVIQRLQHTQIQQKNAFSELESVLSSSKLRPKTPEKIITKAIHSSGKKP